MNETGKLLNVLLVENVIGKTRLIRDALQRSQNTCRLHAIGIGQNTMSYLRKDGPFASAPTPDLVLFDMSEAEKRHLKFLDRVQKDTSEKSIPMVILTSALSEKMFEDTYENRGGCVIFSPIELDHFLRAMRSRSPERFLSAVSLIQKIGFVMVRVPGEFSDSQTINSSALAH